MTPFTACALVALGAFAAPGAHVNRTVLVMGTELRMEVFAPSRPLALRATETIYQATIEMDGLLSTWRPSALDSLNHAAVSQPVVMAPRLDALLSEVLAWRDSTDGTFEPVSGALVDAWDLRGAGRMPSDAELRLALGASGRAAMQVSGGNAVRRRPAAWLDSGGFGKGAALRAAERALGSSSVDGALLDFGGQVLAIGAPSNAPAWTIAVADPQHRQQPVLELHLRDVSAATSAQSERFVTVGGMRYGHILDPHTGRPVPAWGSVTVIPADPLLADILSTALFVMGAVRGLAWADRHPDLGAVFVVSDGPTPRILLSTGALRFVPTPPVPVSP